MGLELLEGGLGGVCEPLGEYLKGLRDAGISLSLLLPGHELSN